MNIKIFIDSLDIAPSSAKKLAEILETVDQPMRSEWLSKVIVRDGRIAGTRYKEIADKLSFNNFVALYTALGYDFRLMATWADWRCGHGGCTRSSGDSCNTETCT